MRPLVRVAAIVAAVLLAMPGAAVATGRSTPARPSGSGAVYEYIKGIAAAPLGRAWAVGTVWPTTQASRSVIERWTGERWRMEAGPNLGVSSSSLAEVAVVARHSAWAVGKVTGGLTTGALIERWNGRSWRRVRSPSPGGLTGTSSLSGIAALSPRQAWAVGFFTFVAPPPTFQESDRTLVEHWNGKSWRQVASPSPGDLFGSYLLAVGALSGSSAWAVGYYYDGAGHQHGMILRWNGRNWQRSPSPHPGDTQSNSVLYGVVATSPRNAWAVGAYSTTQGTQTLIERWNGRRWRQVRSPDPAPGSYLYAVAASSSSDAWAVGEYLNRTLTVHWNGTAWRQVPSPDPSGPLRESFLSAVAVSSPSSAWAGGFYDVPGAERTLILHWNGKIWRHTPSPN
jgi:hypothetical protein